MSEAFARDCQVTVINGQNEPSRCGKKAANEEETNESFACGQE